jgi:hypothetical protein
VNHRAEQRLDCGRRRLGAAGRVVDLDRRDPAARDENTPGFAQRRMRVADVLEEPHHPDVVERLIAERERERVSLHKRRVHPRSPKVSAGEFELLLLDVDAVESDLWEFLTKDSEDGADSAANLE